MNIEVFPADTGCQEATFKLGHQSRCLECPFANCIHSLKYREKQLILNAETVSNVITCFDAGMSVQQIRGWFQDIPSRRINNWIKNRSSIQKKLSTYSAC